MKETVSVHDKTQETGVCLPIYAAVANNQGFKNPGCVPSKQRAIGWHSCIIL